jgi:hypothetical protein
MTRLAPDAAAAACYSLLGTIGGKITAGEWKSDRKVKRKETLFFFSFCRLLLLVTE